MKTLIFAVLAFLSMPVAAMTTDQYVALFGARCTLIHGLEQGTPEHKKCIGYLALEEMNRMDSERRNRVLSIEKQQTACMWIYNVWVCN